MSIPAILVIASGNAHERYISWEEFDGNSRRLRENAQAYGLDRS